VAKIYYKAETTRLLRRIFLDFVFDFRYLPDRIYARRLAHRGDERRLGGVVAVRKFNRPRFTPVFKSKQFNLGALGDVVVSSRHLFRFFRLAAVHENAPHSDRAAQYFHRFVAPTGARLKSIKFETTEKFGTNRLADFSWKDRLDLDACTECGRCTEVCPANIVGKELSPRDIILDLRDLMHGKGEREINNISTELSSSQLLPVSASRFALPIIGTLPATVPEALWQCTTCGACMEACPVFIEQMPKIVEMRRFQVMEEADFPDKMQEAVTSLETRGHPFRGTQATRIDWTEGLDIKNLADLEKPENAELEVLLWAAAAAR
jgi:heterodisulfide reductase subunit C